MSESRCTHSAASSGTSDGGGALAGEGVIDDDPADDDPADDAAEEEGAADDGAEEEAGLDDGAADEPLGSAGRGAFVPFEASGGGSGLLVWAIAASGVADPARAPNTRKKRE